MERTTRAALVRQVVYAIERTMLPSPGGWGSEPEGCSQFSEAQPATLEASVHTGLITAVRPGIVPRTSYGPETEYHHLPATYLVFPGLVDPHVHLNEPGRTAWEGFETGTNVNSLPPFYLELISSFQTHLLAFCVPLVRTLHRPRPPEASQPLSTCP
jgi:hypothetical protein